MKGPTKPSFHSFCISFYVPPTILFLLTGFSKKNWRISTCPVAFVREEDDDCVMNIQEPIVWFIFPICVHGQLSLVIIPESSIALNGWISIFHANVSSSGVTKCTMTNLSSSSPDQMPPLFLQNHHSSVWDITQHHGLHHACDSSKHLTWVQVQLVVWFEV
jgi:hypothetical protein